MINFSLFWLCAGILGGLTIRYLNGDKPFKMPLVDVAIFSLLGPIAACLYFFERVRK